MPNPDPDPKHWLQPILIYVKLGIWIVEHVSFYHCIILFPQLIENFKIKLDSRIYFST